LMMRSAVLMQYTRVTDRRTDGIGVAYTALSIASRDKNGDGRWMGNMVKLVIYVYVKFNYGRLRIAKALGNFRKCDNKKKKKRRTDGELAQCLALVEFTDDVMISSEILQCRKLCARSTCLTT